MTVLQVRAFADQTYPAEIRSFLDAHGYQALYERDFNRALAAAAGAGAALSPTGKGETGGPRRSEERATRWGAGLRIVLLATALAAGGLILKAAFPSVPSAPGFLRNAEVSSTAPATVAAPALELERIVPTSPCVQSMRDGATAWCESALTGSPIGDAEPEAKPGGCGDPLKVNSDTVRLALNRILEDDATYTYRYDEARERCAAAAKLAAP